MFHPVGFVVRSIILHYFYSLFKKIIHYSIVFYYGYLLLVALILLFPRSNVLYMSPGSGDWATTSHVIDNWGGSTGFFGVDTSRVWALTTSAWVKTREKGYPTLLYDDENFLWSGFCWNRSGHGNVTTPLRFLFMFVFLCTRSFFKKSLKGVWTCHNCLNYGRFKFYESIFEIFWNEVLSIMKTVK